MKILLFVLFLWVASVSLAAQTSDWDRLRRVPAGTHVHVAADSQSKTCAIDLIDEATLRCSKGASQYSFLRAEVKSVKLTRYGRSALVGAVMGLGAGAGVGAAAGHAQEKPGDFFPGLSTEAYAAVGAAAGALAGAAIGGPTDFLRGPTVYRRP
jgi:hypothetical protein